MANSSDKLFIGFGQDSITVTCDDADLRQIIGRYFRHCPQNKDKLPLAAYRILQKGSGWQLLRNGEALNVAKCSSNIIEWLIQDMIVIFIKHNQSSLALHAAGLSLADKGIILCGKSGSGKSTLAAWLVAAGYGYLSDELVNVQFDGSKMTGFSRPLLLRSGSSFIWEQWRDKEIPLPAISSSGNSLLEPTSIRPNSIKINAYPSLLLFPTYDPEMLSISVKTLSASEATYQLMQHCVNIRRIKRAGLLAAANLAQQVSAYSLVYSQVVQVENWLSAWISSDESMLVVDVSLSKSI